LNITEKINNIIDEKGLTRKYFVNQLILLNPILKSTGETPSSSTIYGYLNGNREVKIELLPYIAKVLNVSIADLFDETEKNRIKILQNILKSPTLEEKKLLENYFKFEEKINNYKLQNEANYNLYKYIFNILPFASEKFLYTLIDVLESFKDSTIRAEEEIKS
jgi:transcriptional regulator with XRE-family HTH domain